MSIQVQALSKTYEAQRAVDAISFVVQPGEIVGFLGPNGAGKSTTMKMLTGYLTPSSGTATVAGHDILTDPMAVRRSVGYLPEHNPLYLDMYVTEFLQFAGSLHGMGGRTLTQRINDVVDLVGLGTERNKRIGQLSKGYRQRVGLAQAFLHNPPVLILDEPTTGLDPNQLADIRAVIREVGKDKTVLFSTHIMQEVEALCDRVVIINKGQLVANSSLAELRTQQAGELTLLAEFETDLPNSSILTTLPGITSVTPVGSGQYRLTALPNTDIRAALFRLAADKGLTLIGLRQQEASLEALFKELTQ
ncbi:gliding motility-associated ABC transporter ATP-binding subunit GldA [Fibrella sp. HMF5335]|uniref:Gliding motility-associated ABC transporter ATP-binding subunit GldA n=1 Tax=Fibrella rubiginis TaxID=2817060 RepID=A0A939K6J1_9BACT|nr:gliding motility-associated ABC transporter ATP-binding subunit GldA [Fibrella rubiginis]MBO0937600.1 gliding motility-associated ABC transporter ATP-binding subunit GldA [Fibrella rubiginis]